MKSLKECCNIATPSNGLGIGGVDPLNADPIPVKKRKMKSLKDKIKNKNKEHS